MMKAAIYEAFQQPLTIQTVPDPTVPDDGVVIRVQANGICRSDWHGWMGHDGDIKVFPHVPGHELAGIVAAVGKQVKNWRIDDRVTLPFSAACGHCPQCQSGNHQICDNYFQPGFTQWGSFAQFVAIPHADVNLVRLPESMDFVEAASLGCRFITSFRAVVAQGRTAAGDWVAVHGCGGIGLSAIMIANALGAQTIAIDIDDDKLKFAQDVIGATHTINASTVDNIPQAIQDLTQGGAHVSIDALGSTITCRNSILGLRKRGRHIQVGLMVAGDSQPPIPMGPVLSKELEIIGSHGMQAYEYERMMSMITAGKLQPKKLIGQTVTLEESIGVLMTMNNFPTTGITVIDRF